MVMLPAWKLCFENPPSRRRTVQKEELGKNKNLKTRTCLVVLENHGEARMALEKRARGRVAEKKVRSHKTCDFLSPNKMGSIAEFGAGEAT